jgi:hypothetical protein
MSDKAFAHRCRKAPAAKPLRRGRVTLITVFWMVYGALAGAVLPLGAGVAIATLTSCKETKKITNAMNTPSPGEGTTVTPGTPTVGQ